MKKDIKLYDGMLELHDEHTFWKLQNDTIKNVEWYMIEEILKKYFKMFENKFNVKLYNLGRSGRHICVEDNDWNRRHYKSMQNYSLKLEKMFVDEFNEIDFEEVY